MYKVLIIEDNVDLADNIFLLLKELGYDSICAHNGDRGLKMIIEEKPDIILCDIMLPDISGYKLLSELKKLEGKIMPIFIYLTAKTQRDDLRKGMTIGADDYITKPFTNDELLKAINTQLRKRSKILVSLNSLSDNNRGNIITAQKSNKRNDTIQTELKYDDHIFINDRKNPGFYFVKDILFIKSLKDYTRIYLTENKRFLMRKPMIYWVKTLPADQFLRIHRQTLINLNFIEKIEPLSSNRFSIFMKSISKKLEVSQRYSHKIKKIFK